MDRFNPTILGLGDLATSSRRVEAMAAMFDLGGFTNFCKQIDPHLSVPVYLSRFLGWLMGELKKETVIKNHATGSELYHPLPFFLKFMSDGLLILWDCEAMGATNISNVVVSLHRICQRYTSEFLPKINQAVVEPPSVLRCGIARGTVFSVGDSSDYVGSCINMSARLEKLPGVHFAFNMRGIYLHETVVKEGLFLVQKVAIRGIGDNELISVTNRDLAKMNEADRKLYRKP